VTIARDRAREIAAQELARVATAEELILVEDSTEEVAQTAAAAVRSSTLLNQRSAQRR
jgi:hypothetical protein